MWENTHVPLARTRPKVSPVFVTLSLSPLPWHRHKQGEGARSACGILCFQFAVVVLLSDFYMKEGNLVLHCHLFGKSSRLTFQILVFLSFRADALSFERLSRCFLSVFSERRYRASLCSREAPVNLGVHFSRLQKPSLSTQGKLLKSPSSLCC